MGIILRSSSSKSVSQTSNYGQTLFSTVHDTLIMNNNCSIMHIVNNAMAIRSIQNIKITILTIGQLL